MATRQTEATKRYFSKMIRINLVVDPNFHDTLIQLKKEFGSVNLGMQELLKKYSYDKRS